MNLRPCTFNSCALRSAEDENLTWGSSLVNSCGQMSLSLTKINVELIYFRQTLKFVVHIGQQGQRCVTLWRKLFFTLTLKDLTTILVSTGSVSHVMRGDQEIIIAIRNSKLGHMCTNFVRSKNVAAKRCTVVHIAH